MNAADVIAVTTVITSALHAALAALAKGEPLLAALLAAQERIADERAVGKFANLDVRGST